MKTIISRSLLIFGIALFVACTPKPTSDQHAHGTTYTCPMHTDVIRAEPGKCPVCGMDLVLVEKKTTETHKGLMLSDSQIRLANITTQKAMTRQMGQTVVLNAKLAVDEEHTEVISSRAAGRIERLYIKETGRAVRAGEPIMEIYSETLITLQREYLLAVEQADQLGKTEPRYASFVTAARKKLLLYGLTERQVDQLTSGKTIQNRITFLAPAAGIVTSITAFEGQYIEEGASLYRLEDIRELWVEAELYPGETALMKAGDKVRVKIVGFEHVPSAAIVTFVSPEYRDNSQVTVVRASLDNRQGIYKPGMQAQVFISHSERKALALPIDAVIREEKGSHVFVMTDKNTFEARIVATGLEDVDWVEITSGLKEGEVVAITGAYLLHSELTLKGHND